MRPELTFAFSYCSHRPSSPAPARLSSGDGDDDVITSAPPLAEVSRLVPIDDGLDDATTG